MKRCFYCGKTLFEENFYALRHYMPERMEAALFCSLNCLKAWLERSGFWEVDYGVEEASGQR